MARLIDADELIELIDDDIAALDNDIPQIAYDVCLCTLQMVKQYINALPTVPMDWKSIMDDWTEHDNAMIAKGRELERRLNAPKHGHWIYTEYENGHAELQCSECIEGVYNKTKFCSNCGADMREVEE